MCRAISMTLESIKLSQNSWIAIFKTQFLFLFLYNASVKKWSASQVCEYKMKSTRVGYRFLSLALLHTTNCFKESETDTEKAVGRRTWREADSKTAWHKWKGRQGDTERGRQGERQDEKRRWLVASCYSMMISCLARCHRYSQTAFTSAGLHDRMQCRGKVHNNHSNDQKLPVKLTFFTMCVKQKHMHTVLWYGIQLSEWVFPASLSQFPHMCCIVSICLSVCFCSIALSFVLCYFLCSPKCVLSRKEPVVVEPGEWTNFAGYALFLSISVVLSVSSEPYRREWTVTGWIYITQTHRDEGFLPL